MKNYLKKMRTSLNEFIYKYHSVFLMRVARAPVNHLRRIYRRYRVLWGEKMGLSVPQDFTLKLEWLKYFDRNPLMVTCADKIKVKDYVAEIIGDEYITKTLQVYDNANDIDFGELPSKFVLKTNNASSTNIIIKDKSKIDIPQIRKKLNKWLACRTFGKKEHEWHYLRIKPKILCEEFIDTPNGDDLSDFKIFCLNGIARFVWKDIGRYTTNKSRAIFDINWKRIDMTLFTKNYDGEVPKPKNYEKMVKLAEKLSKPFKEVRIDFYNIDGKIYFGEMTFFSGDLIFYPRKYNKIWGAYLDLKK